MPANDLRHRRKNVQSLWFLMQLCAMLQRLKDKWQVSWPRFILIFTTFALGGSACGYLGRKLLGLTGIDTAAIKIPVYIIIVTLLWPVCVLVISIPLGQFGFFRNYLKKMGTRIAGRSARTKTKGASLPSTHSTLTRNIAIFASGTGTNAKRIIEHFSNGDLARVALVVCNNPKAGVLQIAADNNIPVMLLNRKGFTESQTVLGELRLHKIDLVVLAGFLWQLPGYLVNAFPRKIVNIHPALLPKFGGKGMYGAHVHRAVIDAGEKESGITIHYVDEHYDNGDIIFQATCEVRPTDDVTSLAQRIHQLEHLHYPRVIETLVQAL